MAGTGARAPYGWEAGEVPGPAMTEFLYSDPAAYETIKKALLNHADSDGELRQLTAMAGK